MNNIKKYLEEVIVLNALFAAQESLKKSYSTILEIIQ